MEIADHVQDLLVGYHAWANQRIFGHVKSIPKGSFHEEVQNVFPSISTAFAHIYFTDSIW